MKIADSLLPEFEQEMATTRRVLERVPEARGAWRPHAKSWTLGELALHVARVPSWAVATLKHTELDLNPPGGFGPQPTFTTTAALVAMLDQHVAAARAALTTTSDADFAVPWSLKNAGKTVFTLPRLAVLRSAVLSHLIHHRGQLSVYLRLVDVPVPPIYGPTADESPF